MGVLFDSMATVGCPNCGAIMKSETIGFRCPICKTFIDMQGGIHLHKEKPFMPPRTNFDKITASPEALAEVLEGEYGNMKPGTALAWLRQIAEEG